MEKYNSVWDKNNADIKKEFDSEPVYNKKILKTKTKYYSHEATDVDDINSSDSL